MLPAVGTTPDSRDLRPSKEASVELRLRRLNSLSFIRKSDQIGFENLSGFFCIALSDICSFLSAPLEL